tara:strand:- start:2920 stop:3489 length:570 start_codon:yes stop_codon:yes gene_type:complete
MAWQMMAAQGAMNVGSSLVSTFQASAQSKAARAQALAEVDRLHREMGDVRDQYRGRMDDRAREADYQMGAMIAAMADNGGAGTMNESRMAGEISFFEGVDIGRLEKSRVSAINRLKSGQVAANQNALNVQTKAWQGAMSSWLKTGTDAAGTYLKDKYGKDASGVNTPGTIAPMTSGRSSGVGYAMDEWR